MAHKNTTQEPGTRRKRGWKFRLMLLALWTAAVLLLWAGLARLLPDYVPPPGIAFRASLTYLKAGTDSVYNWLYKDDLERSADRVRHLAEEQVFAAPDTSDVYERRMLRQNDTSMRRAGTRSSYPRGKAGKLKVSAMVDSILQKELHGLSLKPDVGGKVINIVVIGIDSRLGARGARADAIHLVTINPDSAVIDIMSIPRGAYLDRGYPDTSNMNKITYERQRGMKRFLRSVEKVSGRSPIRYYVEAGFSQVMGILELLKYKDPVGTLRFLRARKAFYTGDVQRSFNQGLFIRQSLLDRFTMLTGATGEIVISTGLQFVSTNLTKDMCKGMVYALKQKGFPRHRADAVRAKILPKYKFKLKSLLPDAETIATVEHWADRHGEKDRDHERYITQRLRKINRLAMRDSARPGRIIWRLERIADQHAWLQVQTKPVRYGIRDTLLGLLEYAYEAVQKPKEAQWVRDLKRAEDILWQVNGLPNGTDTRETALRDSIPQ